MLNDRYRYGKKHLERSSGVEYCYHTINSVYSFQVKKGNIKEPNNTLTPADIADKDQFFTEIGYDLWYNILKDTIMVNGVPSNDHNRSALELALAEKGIAERNIRRMILAYAGEGSPRSYHPMHKYFDELSSQVGTDTIRALFNHFTFDGDNDLLFSVFTKWLVGIVHRLYHHSQNFCLIFEGKQEIGKSFLPHWLLPDPDWGLDQDVDPDNKDHQVALCTTLIWEMGELGSTTRKRDIDSLKSFLTRNQVKVRRAYHEHITEARPICSFFGTVNDSEYLRDTTGNRRFFPFLVTAIDHGYSTNVDKERLWGEIVTLYRNGFDTKLSEEEKNYQQMSNDDRIIRSELYDIFSYHMEPEPFNNSTQHITGFVSSLKVFTFLANYYGMKADTRKVAETLQILGYKRCTVRIEGKITRGYKGCKLRKGDILES